MKLITINFINAIINFLYQIFLKNCFEELIANFNNSCFHPTTIIDLLAKFITINVIMFVIIIKV